NNSPAGDHSSSSKGMPALPAVSGSKMAFVEEMAKAAVNFAPTIMAMGERAKTKKMLDKAQRPQRSPAPDEDLGRLDSLVDDLKPKSVKEAALAALR
ncbi:MAG TPA: hypothetical protein VGP68_14075, partial [Gemmataceae bacterium]|nr:hypothetical protein [Gemmataceae bacterium]